jgi:hypothetical protein
MAKIQFQNDFNDLRQFYPDFEYEIYENLKFRYRIKGVLPVYDAEGCLYGVFRISIYFKETYPLGFAALQEVSNFIPRLVERHMDNNGFCCVCV